MTEVTIIGEGNMYDKGPIIDDFVSQSLLGYHLQSTPTTKNSILSGSSSYIALSDK